MRRKNLLNGKPEASFIFSQSWNEIPYIFIFFRESTESFLHFTGSIFCAAPFILVFSIKLWYVNQDWAFAEILIF